ncbi:MAG TPA: FecR domain-containing protein [Rhodoferax sp.]|nr:FecR domain-containing protein [Rhodoferax sp.]
MKQLILSALCLGTMLSLAPPLALAQDAGVVKLNKGSNLLERDGTRLPITVGSKVRVNDRVLTGADGSVGIMLQDNTMLSAGPNSTLQMNKFAFDTTTHAGILDASVKRGTVAVISGKIAKATPQNVSFSTPSMTLGVRGTAFIIDAGQRSE